MGFEPALEAVFFVAMMSSLVFLLGLDLKPQPIERQPYNANTTPQVRGVVRVLDD